MSAPSPQFRNRVSLWLMNTGAICFAAAVLMLITNDREGRTFYPGWLIWSVGGVCVVAGIAGYLLRPPPPPPPPPRARQERPSEPAEAAWTHVEWSNAARRDHALIERLCRRNKIELELRVRGQNGHASSPDEWSFSAPIPLTAADLAEIEKHPTLKVVTVTTAHGIVVAREFAHTAGWWLYAVRSSQA
jgi:hypothetical protein